jgi:ribonuclease HII
VTQSPVKPRYVIGIDEVGRGPLAGPTTVGVFAIKTECMRDITDLGAKDSKQLSEQKRKIIVKKIKELVKQGHAQFVIVSSSSHMIDRKGISKAIHIALVSGLKKLEKKLSINPNHMDIYLDGGLSAGKRYFRQHTVIKGDATIPAIACASILAKVHRDTLMENYDLVFPQYGFYQNKGYGTPDHYHAIRKYGPSTLHRRSFLKNLYS